MRILVVEDEPLLADAVAEWLRGDAHAVDVVHDGASALERAEVNDYDVVVLDRDLPLVHGDQVCRALADGDSGARVLMLTAAGGVDDRVEGLVLGADDYLTKPFAFRELSARVVALGRRARTAAAPVLEHGGIRLDLNRREVYRGGRYVPLSRKEFAVLTELLLAGGAAVSAERLLEKAWDENADPFTNAVRITILKLRRKLGEPAVVMTEPGVGTASHEPSDSVAVDLPDQARAGVRGLFLLAGVVLLAVTYVLVSQRLTPGGGKGVSVLVDPTDGLPTPSSKVSPTTLDGLLKSQGDQSRHDALVALLTQGGIALAVVGATAVALGWLIAGRMLQPLQRMTETARRIADAPAADRGLHERIALNGPHDEVRKLADTFDAMIERLDHSFDGQRRFVANASHELRTPLTLNRALIEVAVRRHADSLEIVSLGGTLLEINARHERLIEGLLLLTRAEPEVLEHSFVDLADVVEHLACQLPGGPVEVRTEAAEAPTSGDPVLLERLVHNLIENGVRHNLAEGGWLRITSGTRDNSAELVISNTGQVIPRYEVQQLFEPFHRFGGDRLAAASGGAGLGLSIVQAVARAHGGDVRAEARDGGGLVVTVTLPLASSVE